MKRQTVSMTVAADGTGTFYSGPIHGRIHAILYRYGTLANGTDITITGETTGTAVLTKANQGQANADWYPRAATHHAVDASAALYAAGGTAVNDYIHVYDERLKIVLADGGNALTGSIIVVHDD
jgi:hypothetical protein